MPKSPPITEILTIVESIGAFAAYKGLDGQEIYGNQLQAVLAKQMLKQLSPKKGWESSPVTELEIPLSEQTDDGIITVGPESYLPGGLTADRFKQAFGENKCTISKHKLKELADTARIVTNSSMVTPELFLMIQQNFIPHIKSQERRTLQEIINEHQELASLSLNPSLLGYSSQEDLNKVLNMPLTILGSNICHSQELHFFVEQRLEQQNGKQYAFNKLREGNLDDKTPCVLLSIPGINLRYGGLPVDLKTDGDITLNGSVSAKQLAHNMWGSVLNSALLQKCNNIVMPAIGLGAFAGNHPETIAKIYFEELFKLLQDPRYKNQFNVLFNPIQYKNLFNNTLQKYQNKIQENGCYIQAIDCDTKMLAIEFAKKGHKCALLNPSDMDVVLGKYDVGEYYKKGHYVGEEDLAATSTAAVGSQGISDCYTNPSKIIATFDEHIGTNITNEGFYEQYHQYQATVYTWGAAPSAAAKAMLFGGTVGHAAIQLTFPCNQNTEALINTYVNPVKIPLEIVTDEHNKPLYYKVYFSVWPSHQEKLPLRLSSSLISDQLDERYGVDYDYKKHDPTEEVFEPIQQVQAPTKGLLTSLKSTITLPPAITIEYKYFNDEDIKTIKQEIENIQKNPRLKTMDTQEITEIVNNMQINLTTPKYLPLVKILLTFKCLELQMINKELEIYSHIKELIKLKQSYTESSKSLQDEIASNFEDDDSVITSILSTLTLAMSAINITSNKIDEFNLKTATLIPTDEELQTKTSKLGTNKEEERMTLLAAAKKSRSELKQTIVNLYNSHNKELELERYIKIGYAPQSMISIPIYEPKNEVGLQLPAMLEKMAEIAKSKKSFNLLRNNCSCSVLAVLNNGIGKSTGSTFPVTTPQHVKNKADDIDNSMMHKFINKQNNKKDIRKAIKSLQEARGTIIMGQFTDLLNQLRTFFTEARQYLFIKKAQYSKMLFSQKHLPNTTKQPNPEAQPIEPKIQDKNRDNTKNSS